MIRLKRFWWRVRSKCWFNHVGSRIRIHRDNNLFYQCSECHLEIHQVLANQVPRIDYAIPGKEPVKPITTSSNIATFGKRRNG